MSVLLYIYKVMSSTKNHSNLMRSSVSRYLLDKIETQKGLYNDLENAAYKKTLRRNLLYSQKTLNEESVARRAIDKEIGRASCRERV